ncbi:hypothetical protein ASG89_16730 [Paenibacillus sp. Soil766]|uniref:hypothetical protein n=1 Tax=Paenibacillus sp. Soil766 TaxID=1736404 RepID=UPI000709E799|nr:hypothetical protein [Paenibacillus sp. Soil766]KRF08077.1 hypothetical protein ASG89_16730 [Paenibacillus sp. Soil766]
MSLRNILLSFVFHVLILVMTGILFRMGNHPVLLIVVMLLVVVGYTVLGNIFLQPLGSVAGNLLSVSFVSLVGFIIGLYAWMFPSMMGWNWMLFLGYYLYIFGLVDALNSDPGPHTTFWFFVVPSLFLWIGLQLKASGHPISGSHRS